jgi:tetratricopeptide (TPR) repeat protein
VSERNGAAAIDSGSAAQHANDTHEPALEAMKPPAGNIRPAAALCLIFFAAAQLAFAQAPASPDGFAGSRSCMECHERFYTLWSTSFHGLAMQPYSRDLAATRLSPQQGEIAVGKYRYRADLSGREGWVHETGPQGRKRYKIEHVLGGKNVYYFLTPMEKGRLQTLPLAYDVQKKQWYDMAGSGTRHFPGRRPDEPVDWRDWPYTFNTACHGCHVSQLSTHYDPKTDIYDTIWLEPGINCETCHGPSEEHNRLFKELPPGAPPPTDPRIISVRKFTPGQHNDSCSSCHAKASALTTRYPPGERFFDHFDLVTLESSDYYPDGRDLGENYTLTTWLTSPCVKDGRLNCIACHTSSGRYRFKAAENANDACLPCHRERVADPTAHTRHKTDSPGNRCIACHMPMTEFARMRRSDHSMRPPAPAATIRFKSPNACNGCHKDKTPQWADRWVRRWHTRDYQGPALQRAGLIEAARRRDWKRLPEMLDAITDKDRDEVFANSLVRLLRPCGDERIAPVLRAAINDPSPLVRSSAAESLGLTPSAADLQALAAATGDDYRLVRIRAAQALAGIPGLQLGEPHASTVKKATEEYLASMTARPDQWTSHYNLGNYYLGRQKYSAAVSSYATAIRFDPGEIPPWLNLSIAYARQGDTGMADQALGKALALDPNNAEANFNMGLLKAELNDLPQAETHLRRTLKADPQMAPAAYNLCVLIGERRPKEALGFCRQAAALQPREPRYVWTTAYYQNRNGERKAAATTLESLLNRQPSFADAYLLLAGIHLQSGAREKAQAVYDQAIESNALSPRDRSRIQSARQAYMESGPQNSRKEEHPKQ